MVSGLANLATYYWQVSATNANGTSAWSSTWSFTTIITAPGAPTLSLPAIGATGEPLSLALSWAVGTGGTPASYALQVSTTSTFSTTVSNQTGITGTTAAVSGLVNLTAYYWEVNATNANGTSVWSGIWNFTTIIAAPGAPTLSSPATGVSGQSVTPTLTWSAGSGGTPASYSVLVSTTTAFSSTVYSQSGTSRDVGDDEQPVELDDILLAGQCDKRKWHERVVGYLELYNNNSSARIADAVESIDRRHEPECNADTELVCG